MGQLTFGSMVQKDEYGLPLDYDERVAFLGRIVVWLGERGVDYVPLDIHEGINASAAEDVTDVYKARVKGWAKALAREAA